MAPLNDGLRIAALESKVFQLELQLTKITTGMMIARWIVGVSLAVLAVAVSRGM